MSDTTLTSFVDNEFRNTFRRMYDEKKQLEYRLEQVRNVAHNQQLELQEMEQTIIELLNKDKDNQMILKCLGKTAKDNASLKSELKNTDEMLVRVSTENQKMKQERDTLMRLNDNLKLEIKLQPFFIARSQPSTPVINSQALNNQINLEQECQGTYNLVLSLQSVIAEKNEEISKLTECINGYKNINHEQKKEKIKLKLHVLRLEKNKNFMMVKMNGMIDNSGGCIQNYLTAFPFSNTLAHELLELSLKQKLRCEGNDCHMNTAISFKSTIEGGEVIIPEPKISDLKRKLDIFDNVTKKSRQHYFAFN
uniref:Uncharacterized protein n=1 Tax=Rhabditophanes sp. KR3021 TaxID=114890 RepID=A0AC35TMF0_9BILA